MFRVYGTSDQTINAKKYYTFIFLFKYYKIERILFLPQRLHI